jgi:hypothetical protein
MARFTLEELREVSRSLPFAQLRRLWQSAPEAVDLLVARLDKLGVSYHPPEHGEARSGNLPEHTNVEISEASFLYRLHFDSHPDYGRAVGFRPTDIETQHRWHDLARHIDGALREAIPGLRYSSGGPAARFVCWAIKRITDETVELGAVAKELQRQRDRRN